MKNQVKIQGIVVYRSRVTREKDEYLSLSFGPDEKKEFDEYLNRRSAASPIVAHIWAKEPMPEQKAARIVKRFLDIYKDAYVEPYGTVRGS